MKNRPGSIWQYSIKTVQVPFFTSLHSNFHKLQYFQEILPRIHSHASPCNTLKTCRLFSSHHNEQKIRRWTDCKQISRFLLVAISVRFLISVMLFMASWKSSPSWSPGRGLSWNDQFAPYLTITMNSMQHTNLKSKKNNNNNIYNMCRTVIFILSWCSQNNLISRIYQCY